MSVSMIFYNYSPQPLGQSILYHKMSSFYSLSETPADVIRANSGVGRLKLSANLSFLATGKAEVYVCYGIGEQNIVGIKAICHVQSFGIGKRPIWEIMKSDSKWHPATSKPIDYVVDDLPNQSSLRVTATPDSEHTSLSINVIIEGIK